MSVTLLAQIVDAARTKITAGRFVEVFFGDRRIASEPLAYSGLVQVRYDLTGVQTFAPSAVPGLQRNGLGPFQRVEPCEAIISCQSTEVGATEDEHLAYLIELSDAVVDALFGAARTMKVDASDFRGTFISFDDGQANMRGVHYRLAFSLRRAIKLVAAATSAAPSVAAVSVVADGIVPENICGD